MDRHYTIQDSRTAATEDTRDLGDVVITMVRGKGKGHQIASDRA